MLNSRYFLGFLAFSLIGATQGWSEDASLSNVKVQSKQGIELRSTDSKMLKLVANRPTNVDISNQWVSIRQNGAQFKFNLPKNRPLAEAPGSRQYSSLETGQKVVMKVSKALPVIQRVRCDVEVALKYGSYVQTQYTLSIYSDFVNQKGARELLGQVIGVASKIEGCPEK